MLVAATAVHLACAGLLALGIGLLLSGDPLAAGIVGAVALWMCPWLRRPNGPSGVVIAEVDLAAVRQWARELAAELDVKPPQRIVVSPGELVGAGRTPQGRRSLRIGLLCFALLDDVERRAVMRSELARWGKGTALMSVWVNPAMRAVARPLVAVGLVGSERQQPFALRQDAFAQPIGRLGFVLLRLIVMPLLPIHLVLAALSSEERMRAEYAADRLATADGGAAELCRALRLLSMRDDLAAALRGQVQHRTESIDWADARKSMQAIPVSEVTRRLLVEEERQLRRGTAAPTIDRIRQLERWAPSTPLPSATSSVDIDAVVRPALDAWSRELANSW